MVGHAGICGACQKDIIKQDEPTTIYCPTCRTMWNNKYVKGKKASKKLDGYPCLGCGEGMLVQQYWNIIYCNTCGAQWKSFNNRYYNKRAQLRTELSRIG